MVWKEEEVDVILEMNILPSDRKAEAGKTSASS